MLHGGLKAIAMPRGSGKSQICEGACLWAILYGHQDFVLFVGAEAQSAQEQLETIKMSLETNETLLEDFPEACYPIRCLDGIAQRANGQLYQGKRTHIRWSNDEIVLPFIEGSAQFIGHPPRGRHYGAHPGPSLQAARRPRGAPRRGHRRRPPRRAQAPGPRRKNDYRTGVLSADIRYCAGPDKQIAAIMPCTVVCKDDMADRILDRKKHPEWRGERCKFMPSRPTNVKLWDEYADILREDMELDKGVDRANAYYKKRRKAMDAGAVITWEHRFIPGLGTERNPARNESHH